MAKVYIKKIDDIENVNVDLTNINKEKVNRFLSA